MNTITYKNEKSMKRIFKQPFKWAILTVSNENGYHKIALKKNMFKKTYTVNTIINGKLCSEKKEISIEDIANKNITIEGLGNLHIEDINTSFKNPSKIIEQEEKIYSKIDNKARKEEIKQKEIEIKEIQTKNEEAKEQEKYDTRMKEIEESNRVYNFEKNLIYSDFSSNSYDSGYYETNKYIRGKGYTWSQKNESSSSNYKRGYDLSFVIKQLEKYSKKIGFEGFEDNRLGIVENKIKEVNKIKDHKEYIKRKYILHGLLVQELYMRTMDLCAYIRKNNIDISNEMYYDSYSTQSTFYDNVSEYSERETIHDLVNELINSVATYIERVTGENVEDSFQTTVQKQYLMVV